MRLRVVSLVPFSTFICVCAVFFRHATAGSDRVGAAGAVQRRGPGAVSARPALSDPRPAAGRPARWRTVRTPPVVDCSLSTPPASHRHRSEHSRSDARAERPRRQSHCHRRRQRRRGRRRSASATFLIALRMTRAQHRISLRSLPTLSRTRTLPAAVTAHRRRRVSASAATSLARRSRLWCTLTSPTRWQIWWMNLLR